MPNLTDPTTDSAKILLIGDQGCLSGDTLVSTYRGESKSKPKSLIGIYNQLHGQKLQGAPWNNSIPTCLLWDADGQTGLGRMIDVVYSGYKSLILLRVGPKSIKATSDHMFKTTDGWLPLKELSTKSEVFIRDRNMLEGRRKTGKKTKRNVTYSIPYHPFAMRNFVGGRDYKRINTARLILEAEINGITLEELIRILRNSPRITSTLQFIPMDKEVHHLDGDPSNDNPSNLIIIDATEHQKIHLPDLQQETHKTIPIRVEEIFPLPRAQPTFDIIMDDPYHNFIANDIVTHNSGKTGAKAALVATGYKLRMIDCDNGFKILRALLTDEEHYPYASYMKKHNIIPDISYIPIEVPIELTSYQTKDASGRVKFIDDVLGPTSSRAWTTIVSTLREWKDGTANLGSITDWDSDTILDFDTVSTAAELAKYWTQDMNGHLGALLDDHGRDTGGAQEMILRLMMKMANPSVHCNFIGTCHIRRIDMSMDGVPQPIEQRIREKKSVNPRGFPAIIGQAVGPYVGKRVNDVLVVKRDGDGRNAERRIFTTPVENVDTKTSVWLEDSYPVSTGLAEIFARLNYKQPPTEFLDHCSQFYENLHKGTNTNGSQPKPQNQNPKTGGFGSN